MGANRITWCSIRRPCIISGYRDQCRQAASHVSPLTHRQQPRGRVGRPPPGSPAHRALSARTKMTWCGIQRQSIKRLSTTISSSRESCALTTRHAPTAAAGQSASGNVIGSSGFISPSGFVGSASVYVGSGRASTRSSSRAASAHASAVLASLGEGLPVTPKPEVRRQRPSSWCK
jgi:hypothetical protein